ncbi:F-box domain protein [Aspergillus sclerotioniger CBS 115572]|uniref:Probable E3 ubiquitin ligase complex SCF subunit sconB n=1 Tax=Aspergillus sclerotioniger CBS 115572 TaxID=1450535 RepID=A0A317VXP0_9EURO|nr:F-box domain protein [Aspergillus sclerotioniger CBS 115572]PWY78399.1 F-box domain protein [Aspergillus sclerotioniger CBS 115572]
MSKRNHVDDPSVLPPPKRPHTIPSIHIDQITALSDELLIHILSFLPIPSLLVCQQLSRRFHALAGDSELWKRQYYSRWVRPRARRLANARRTLFSRPEIEYSPRVSTWLDHGHLAKEGVATNWKRQYRLRHNWSRGVCRVTEVEFPQPPRRQMLVTFCAGIVFTADLGHGLRVWPAKEPEHCLARILLTNPPLPSFPAPTAIAAAASGPQQSLVDVTVGFEDGRLSVYTLDTTTLRLGMRFSCVECVSGAITTMASCSPFLLLVSEHKVLSLYETIPDKGGVGGSLAPRLLTSLKADSILEPISLSVRATGPKIIASIVYSFYHIGCGWSLGIQELQFGLDGQQISSRLATTVDCHYGTISPDSRNQSNREYRTASYATGLRGRQNTTPLGPSTSHHEPPTSVSYSHPYLLTSHADNTLTVYLVVSTSTSLSVKGCQRLWGHTSSISAVQISDRGKAVSVSSRGDDIRIWELESLISSLGGQKALRNGNSIRISPENRIGRRHDSLGLVPESYHGEYHAARSSSVDIPHGLARMRGCIGFDDERVLLLREKEVGTQMLEFYDFT